jgi:hypothetical protein
MELVLQYSKGSVWPHPFSVVAEPVVVGVLHAIGGKWAAPSGSLEKMCIDLLAEGSKPKMASLFKDSKLEWEAFYKDERCMAAMHQDVFHEALPVLARCDSDRDCQLTEYIRQQADYMRKCADLVVRMTAKRNASSPGV